MRAASDGGRLVDEVQCEVLTKPASLPGLAVAPEPTLGGVEQYFPAGLDEVPNRPITFVGSHAVLERAVLREDVEGEGVVDEDIGECESAVAADARGGDLGVAHFLADEMLTRVWKIDSDVTRAYVCAHTPVVGSVHGHRGVDAPPASLLA